MQPCYGCFPSQQAHNLWCWTTKGVILPTWRTSKAAHRKSLTAFSLHIIANRYFLLNDIHAKYDKSQQDALQAELYKHHFELASALALYLTDEQIDAVKDGMTFGRLKRDYQATQDMIPTLSDFEKQQILIWLKEAREYAMDAADSKGKHFWFDKYRGRTNNWLSGRGYDLKKERDAWMKRIEDAKKK